MKDLQSEFSEAMRRGVLELWEVAESYGVAEGFLVPTSDRSRLYLPAAYPELPAELAKVPEGDEEAALAFVRQWGLLGWAKLRQSYGLPELEEAAGLVEGPPGYPATVGDPLDWFWNHAKTLRLLFTLLKALRKADQESLPQIAKEALEKAIVRLPRSAIGAFPLFGELPSQGSVVEFAGRTSRKLTPYNLSPGELSDPMKALQGLVAAVITLNLWGLEWMVFRDMKQPARFTRLGVAKALLPILYNHLADAACGGRAYAQCQGCGAFFLQADPRQQYCLNPLGGESLCSIKARQRRFREKKASRPEGGEKS